ncbi:MAG: zinc ribbon domain-containing protein [Anaerolineae bacterium]
MDLNSILMGVAIYFGMIAAAFWLAMIIWTYRDMRSRSRDGIAQLLAALLVAVLTLPGLLIYLLLRPRETLAEAYERSLEEEALLQEIEEKPVCPGCGQRVKENWQVCPSCHTRLKKICPGCNSLLELQWNLCPHCATPQVNYTDSGGHVRPAATPRHEGTRASRASSQQAVEFVDSDQY